MKTYRHVSSFGQPARASAPHRAASLKGVPWMTITDTLGFAAALVAVALRTGLDTPAERALVATLGSTSVLLWLLFDQVRTLDTILRGRRLALVAVPAIAAAITASIQYAGGGATATVELLLFTFTWTAALAIARLAHPYFRSERTLLVIGSPAFSRELDGVPGYRVVRLDEPPASFKGVDIVASDPSEAYDPAWLRWMSHANMYGVKVLPAPLVFETLTGRVPFEMLDGRWAFEVLNGRSPYRLWKRVFDVSAVVVTAPFTLAVAAAVAVVVYFDTGRPILFWQDRVGFGGAPFRMVKFRTMRADADAGGTAFAALDDHRVTRAGRFLRQYRLDEIPQLWNVLRGEMSIIGPRPEQVVFAEHFAEEIPYYAHRSSVLPGITGWAQVSDGYAASVDETKSKLRHDFYYVKHCSLPLDLLIVWRTIVTILTGFGAR